MTTRFDFIIDEDCDTDFTIQVYQDDRHTVIQDITDWTASMVVRDFRDSGSTAYLTLTSPSGGLTVDGPAGQIAVHIAADTVTSISWLTGQWDITITDTVSGSVKRAAYGNVSVRAGV